MKNWILIIPGLIYIEKSWVLIKKDVKMEGRPPYIALLSGAIIRARSVSRFPSCHACETRRGRRVNGCLPARSHGKPVRAMGRVYGSYQNYCTTLNGLYSSPGDPHFDLVFSSKLMIFLYKSIFWFTDSDSPWNFDHYSTGEINFYDFWWFLLIFVYFSCNSLVKNHHGSPTGLHGSPTVRLPSGPVQSGRSSPVWSGPVCYGPVRYGPVQPVRSDLVWSGDPWSIPQIGLVWSGLGGFQKIRSPISRRDRTVRNKWPAPICLAADAADS